MVRKRDSPRSRGVAETSAEEDREKRRESGLARIGGLNFAVGIENAEVAEKRNPAPRAAKR